MNTKFILKISAVIGVCTVLSAGVMTVSAEDEVFDNFGESYAEDNTAAQDYTDDNETTGDYDNTADDNNVTDDNTVDENPPSEYIPQEVGPDTVYVPPEPSTSEDNNDYEYFDNYHADAEEYYYDNNYYYDNDYYYDNNDYYNYDNYGYSEETSYADETQQSTPESQIYDQGSVDTDELTAEDWEKIQNSLNSKPDEKQTSSKSEESSKSFFNTIDADDEQSGAFGSLKEQSGKDEQNDVWIYLVVGIPLLLAGLGIIIAVIVVNVKANKKEKSELEAANRPEKDPLSVSIRDINETVGEIKVKKKLFGAKHAAGLRTQGSEKNVSRDLVDTLDEPLDFSKAEVKQ